MDDGVETKRRSQNPKCKHDTWYRRWKGHGKTAMEVPRTGRETIKACERSGQCNNLEGRSNSGNNTSKRSKVTQPKPDTPQKCGRQKTFGWTSLRRPVPNGGPRGPYSLKCRCTTHYGGYIVLESFARKQGNAQDTCWKCKRQNRRSIKKIAYRDLTHCEWTQWREH